MSKYYVIEREDGCLWNGSFWVFVENTKALDDCTWRRRETPAVSQGRFLELLHETAARVGGQVWSLQVWLEDGADNLDDLQAELKADEDYDNA